jgi:undecaprenyl-diphosphatase
MVVPLIFGKVAKDLIDGNIFSEAINLGPLIFGFVAAFFTGLFACKWMIGIVKSSKLKYFSYYCFTVAAIIIIFKLL